MSNIAVPGSTHSEQRPRCAAVATGWPTVSRGHGNCMHPRGSHQPTPGRVFVDVSDNPRNHPRAGMPMRDDHGRLVACDDAPRATRESVHANRRDFPCIDMGSMMRTRGEPGMHGDKRRLASRHKSMRAGKPSPPRKATSYVCRKLRQGIPAMTSGHSRKDNGLHRTATYWPHAKPDQYTAGQCALSCKRCRQSRRNTGQRGRVRRMQRNTLCNLDHVKYSA
jgi:hypothetical protein